MHCATNEYSEDEGKKLVAGENSSSGMMKVVSVIDLPSLVVLP